MKDVTVENTTDYIRNNRPLLETASEAEWTQNRNMAAPLLRLCKVFNLKIDVDYQAVVNAITQQRPEIMNIIRFTPGGTEWLRHQVEIGREKMGFAEPKSRFTRD